MATDTAAAPSKTTSPDPTRHIWQVPLFLLGVFAFVATWQNWVPWGPPDPRTLFLKDLEDLRNTYERVAPARDELNDLLKTVAGKKSSFPDLDQKTHFVLGSGYVRMAELTPGIDEARGYWVLAQKHFELVDREQFRNSPNNPDGSKLAFRANKARAAVGVTPDTPANVVAEMIELLGNNPPFGDDPGEAMRLRADLALRLNPPDMVSAKESLKRYLTGGLATPAISRDRAKILLSDLYYRCKELEDARHWLESITADAPAEIKVAKGSLLGRVSMAEGNWPAAAREWEAVRDMVNVPQSYRTTATLQLGICRLNLHDPAAATKLLEETVKWEDGPETVAAAILLADLYLKSADSAKRRAATELLVKAMKDVSNPSDVRNNTNLNANDARATYELAISTLAGDGAYEAALKIVAAYTPVAEVGWDRERKARILDAWATALKEAKSDYQPKALEAAKAYIAFASLMWIKLTDKSFASLSKEHHVPEIVMQKLTPLKINDWLPEDLKREIARALTEDEAKKYQELILSQGVTFQPPISTRADSLRRAATMFRLGGDPEGAVGALTTASRLPKLSEEIRSTNFNELADALIAAGHSAKEIWDAFNKAMGESGPTSTATRYRLARHFKETRIPELCLLACQLYEQIIKQTNTTQPEQEYQELAFVDLAHEKIKINDFADAENVLRSQLHTYPTGPEAPFGRLLLGVCLLQIANVPPPSGPTPSKAAALRDEALRLFRTVVADADAKQKGGAKLTDREAWVRLQAAIRILQTYLQTKNPNDLLRESADLVERCRNTVEELIIWSLVYHAFKQKNDTVRALETRDKMKELFDRLPASAFTEEGRSEYSRVYWEKTWFVPEK